MSQFGEIIDISARSDYPQLEYGTFRGQLRELLLSQESLISLSDETGGLAYRQFRRSRRRPGPHRARQQPLLHPRLLQRFHQVVAQVPEDRGEGQTARLSVRARKGFLPPDPRATAQGREAEVKAGTTPALRAALSKPVPIGDLPMRVFAAAAASGTGDKGSCSLALEIEAAH